jgi:hypothetical protein
MQIDFKDRLSHATSRLLLIAAALWTSACGFIIESVSDFSGLPKSPAPLSIPVQPIYLTSNTSYMNAEGICQGYKVIEFTYSSALTPLDTVFGKCVDDKVSVKLHVLQGDKNQVFTVKIIGYLENPTQTINLPPSLTVYFTPPIQLTAGFGVTSGGGVSSSASYKIINQSVGETFIGTQTSPSVTARSGLHGALDP